MYQELLNTMPLTTPHFAPARDVAEHSWAVAYPTELAPDVHDVLSRYVRAHVHAKYTIGLLGRDGVVCITSIHTIRIQ